MFRLVLPALLVAALAAPAAAQVWELTPHIGYVTASSVDLRPQGLDGQVRIKDALEYGVGLGISPRRGFTFEARYTLQPTEAVWEPTGTDPDKKLADLTLHQIHGNFLLWKAYPDAMTKPYFLIGLGATIFDPDEASFESNTQFSWALGAGVMRDMSEKAALRLQVRYIPTYITDSYGGTWCDPFYGCYSTVDPEYLNQWEFSGGVTLKFGQY